MSYKKNHARRTIITIVAPVRLYTLIGSNVFSKHSALGYVVSRVIRINCKRGLKLQRVGEKSRKIHEAFSIFSTNCTKGVFISILFL